MHALEDLDRAMAAVDAGIEDRAQRHRQEDDLGEAAPESLPSYPIDALPGILGEAAHAIAEGAQLDHAIAGQSVLAAATLACQHLADVMTPAGVKPMSGFFLTVALSGDGKSTADGPALAPIREAEKTEWARYRQDLAQWESLPKQDRDEKPRNPLRLISDFTSEGIVRQYRDGLPSLGAFSDEAGAVFGGHSFSAERKLATVAALSSLWDGAGIRARARAADDRGGLEAHFDVRLTSHWLIQPGAVAGALRDPILSEQGFWPRTLIATPEPGRPRQYRPFDAASVPEIGLYWKRVTELLDHPYIASEYRHTVTPTPDADLLIGQAFETLEREARTTIGRYAPIRSWAARATEHVLRVAAVLAVFERGEKARIEADEVMKSLHIVEYSLACWLNLLENRPIDEAKDYSQRLLRWLKGQPNQQGNESQILQFGPKPRSASMRDAALGLLAAQERVVNLGGKTWAIR